MSMELTKRLWEQPTDKGVLAYHIIQSFSPSEATPDQVHEIGCEFARRFLADRFECTVSTHLDKGHLHNHIVVNSVSYADGKMFRNNFDTYYHGIRQVSDELCRENRLSVIETDGKDDWEGIIGNCDTLLYLGGNEYGTYEYLSKILGKETERTKSQSIGKGSRGSSSDSLQTAGRELCMPDEIRRMRDDECLLLMRSEDPVIDKKYNLLHHPNVKYTPDAGGEPYVIPPDYMGDAVTITMDAVAAATAPEITEEMYEQLDYLEKHPEENYYENEENFSQWYEQGGE